jgi:hypothetical protein
VLDEYLAEDFVAHNPPLPGVTLDGEGMKQVSELLRLLRVDPRTPAWSRECDRVTAPGHPAVANFRVDTDVHAIVPGRRTKNLPVFGQIALRSRSFELGMPSAGERSLCCAEPPLPATGDAGSPGGLTRPPTGS